MATFSTILPISICLLLLLQSSAAQDPFTSPLRTPSEGFRGDQDIRERCSFEQLATLEPTHQVRSEAGFIEYYNTESRNEFRCAGVNVRRVVIESKGLLLPSYANVHKLLYIVQGSGVFGMALPGCPETFQSVQSPSEQQVSAAGEGQKFWDEHQKLEHFRQGDVIAVPLGVAHWIYNNGDSPVVVFGVTDDSNNANQLNPSRRDFFLAGKPRSIQQQLVSSYEGEAAQQNANNILAGFSADLLAEALGVSRQLAARLQGQNDRRGSIIRVEGGLKALQPSFQGEPISQVERTREYFHDEQATTSQTGDWGHNNGLGESVCSLKYQRNIDYPQSADIFNPRGGRITRTNAQNFPVLDIVRMSATRTVLQNNALLTPHWSVNAHTVVYVTAGQGHIQVVDNRGKSVFDGELRQSQVLLVPQSFAVMVKARREGFAWVSFKTNHNAIDSQIAGKASVLGALPVDVVASAYTFSREESRRVKYNRGDEMAIFAPRTSQQA